MVSFYGAGERTGILNVEGKLGKILGKDSDTLVVKASDRDTVLNEISARIAKYERFDTETANELRVLRQNVKDIFNKGISPGDEIMEQLYFLDPKTKDLVEKMTANYDRVVTPADFKEIAGIMSDHLATQVPILKDFTKFFGRLAEDFLKTSKPSNADFDWVSIAKEQVVGARTREGLTSRILKKYSLWKPGGNLDTLINGVQESKTRRTGAKYLKYDIAGLVDVSEVEIFRANKLPKSWTNIPWVNFDGKVVEQNFTQSFEERLVYRDKDNNVVVNILQVPQKTEATWWEQVINKSGKINDIADASKARTAYAVNGNHSNDATLVKQFHLWGKSAGVPTSTIHDAFFANTVDMVAGRKALRGIYARAMTRNIVKETLDEMRARGMPKEVYEQYLNEAIDIGLIPVPGRSKVGGRILQEKDILKKEDVLKEVPMNFKGDYGWYGVG